MHPELGIWNQKQSTDVHSDSPNQDMAIKLIRRLKNIYETKLGLYFQNKETVLELKGCTIEAYPSIHIDSFRSLDNPKFILFY